MKKILPLLLCLFMALPTMAAVQHEYEDVCYMLGTWSTSVKGKGNEMSGKVVVTDNENGTYDVAISGLYLYFDLGTTTFKNIPGTTTNGVTTFSSNMEFVDGEVEGSGYNRGKTSMLVEGAFSEDECYLYLEGTFQGWADDPMKITFGSPVETPSTPYTVTAEVTYGDVTVTHDADEVRITDNGDGTIKFAYTQFTISEANIVIADYSVDAIPVGEADADGFRSFATTSDNKATVKNIGSFGASSGLAEDLELSVTVSGRFNGTTIEAEGQFQVSGSGTAPMASFSVKSVAAGISAVETGNTAVEGIYTVAGVKSNKLQKGLNIVRKGGKTYKVMVK